MHSPIVRMIGAPPACAGACDWVRCKHGTFRETAMSVVLKPTVLNMILCDEALPDSERPGKLTIVGLISLLRWPEGETTPLRLEQLVALLILTDGRGTGRGRIM